MTVEDVIATARAQSGLTEFGDPAILEGLERLLKAYAAEARFTERGAQMMHGDLVNTLATRIWSATDAGRLAQASFGALALVLLSGVLTWLLVIRAGETAHG